MNNHRRVSVSKIVIRSTDFWRVRFHSEGKIRRRFFPSRASADIFAAKQRGEAIGVRQLLASIPQHDQEKLVMIYNEASRRGVDMLTFLTVETPATKTVAKLRDVVDEMIRVKRTSGISKDYLTSFKTVLNEFIKGRESMAIDQLGLADVEKFLESKKLEYRPTLRARLSTLFKFSVRRGYRSSNPCDLLEPIRIGSKTPAILTIEQTEQLLSWFAKHPRALAWFVLSVFAGFRPDEARKTSWADIHFKEGWIKIEAQTTKIRQRRVVYPQPMVMKWLKFAKSKRSSLPVSRQNLKRDRKAFRAAIQMKKWPKDVTRHTAASMWLAQCGSATDVAMALGHSEKVLKKNYMALVTKVEAEKFWQLLPKTVLKKISKKAKS